jgi:hypothetical protein
MVNNFVMAGKLGDFLHAMFAVKNICERDNITANVYMDPHGFEFGVENTQRELEPILMQQHYMNSLQVLTESNKQKLEQEGFIDLRQYIKSPFLYKCCWSEMYSKTFNFPILNTYKWITYDKVNNDLKGKILIQRKANIMRNPHFPFKQIIDQYGKENFLFISSTKKDNSTDYEEFPYKSLIDYYEVETLEEWFTAINSCEIIIANLSAPAVMAHAMDKPRVIELPGNGDTARLDIYHCMGEELYSNNVRWFVNNELNTIT